MLVGMLRKAHLCNSRSQWSSSANHAAKTTDMATTVSFPPVVSSSSISDAEVDGSASLNLSGSTGSTGASSGEDSSEEPEPKLPLRKFVWGVSKVPSLYLAYY